VDLVLLLVVVVVAIALVFDFTNGFHDTSNAVATSVSTRALTPRTAVALAAAMNLLGALLGTGVAETIGSGIITPPPGAEGLGVVLAALLGAIAWNLLTWWLGMPSSSSHALIGGLLGAGLVAAASVHWQVIGLLVALPMVLSPVVGFVLAYAAMVGTLWVVRTLPYRRTLRGFRMAQTVSAAAMALGHGLQDAQKTMGVIVLALTAGGLHEGSDIPLWVKLSAAAAISLGTYAGGWRIIHTLGRRVIQLDPARGFVAESVSAVVLYVSAFVFHAPISTTHSITSAIMGVGATRRLSAVRWGVAGNIAVTWVLTIPASAAVAAGLYLLIGPLVR
jgi:inorganic phosphate transporter, PiT family